MKTEQWGHEKQEVYTKRSEIWIIHLTVFCEVEYSVHVYLSKDVRDGYRSLSQEPRARRVIVISRECWLWKLTQALPLLKFQWEMTKTKSVYHSQPSIKQDCSRHVRKLYKVQIYLTKQQPFAWKESEMPSCTWSSQQSQIYLLKTY